MFEIPGYWYRGGTSKCWLFDAEAIAPHAGSREELADTLAAAFGAADPRHIDGVGGATSTTAKAAEVRATPGAGHDLEYTFAQVGIGVDQVEFGSNCGNCATAIGLYAVTEGLVPVSGDVTAVRMWNTNSSSLLVARVHTPGGTVAHDGAETVPGSLATGVRVDLVFESPEGAVTGQVLPTGNAADQLQRTGGDSVLATMVDAGAPAVLLRASDMGLTAVEELDEFAHHVPELATIRRQAALRMGLATPDSPVSNAVPKVGVVGAPRDYTSTTGQAIKAEDYDVSVRMVSMLQPHPAIGLTSAVAVAAAFRPGTTVAEAATVEPGTGNVSLRIGTPAGVVSADIERDESGHVIAVGLRRAARRIARAEISVPQPVR